MHERGWFQQLCRHSFHCWAWETLRPTLQQPIERTQINTLSKRGHFREKNRVAFDVFSDSLADIAHGGERGA
jgi:hypothetical protein